MNVTGLLAGGVDGKRINVKYGSLKFTQKIAQKELFAKQRAPYVYPLLKAHKIPMKSLLDVKPDEVYKTIPSRLVVGMQNCQMSRVQRWLENILTPLSKLYGKFEFIQDSNDFLLKLETIKSIAKDEKWNWQTMTLFTIDVKAVYPSVKLDYVKTALKHCFDRKVSIIFTLR